MNWKDDNSLPGILEASMVILIQLPTKRNEASTPERFELYAYVINEKNKVIGDKIGLWGLFKGNIATLLGETDENKNGNDVLGELYNPIFSFDTTMAINSTGLKLEINPNITAIGLGTIGSQIFMNLLRMGFVKWNLIDKDILLPHNLARHVLLGDDIGDYKSDKLSQKANDLYELNYVKSFHTNILKADLNDESIKEAYSNSDLILDMSASIPVARKLAIDVESNSRRISAFLSPNGNDSILLSEDTERTFRLDYLEMAYYRFISQEKELENHLQRPTERLRYGNSCRDISFKLPQDLVSIHSGILSRAIRNAIISDAPHIRIWRTDLNKINIKEYSCPAHKIYINKSFDWTYITDEYFLNKLASLRLSKLPNETGGVIIGSYDMQRKICYVVDTIPSPIDSIEWPTVYIRGCKGLKNDIDKICKVTDNMLTYVGEWHSHPKGASNHPNSDDIKAFEWLTEVMTDYGFPGLMIIASDEIGFYIGKMFELIES